MTVWKKSLFILSCFTLVVFTTSQGWAETVVSHPPTSNDIKRTTVIEAAQEAQSKTISTAPASTPTMTPVQKEVAPAQKQEPVVTQSKTNNTENKKTSYPVTDAPKTPMTASDVIPPTPATPKEKLSKQISRAIAETTYKSLNCLKLGDFYWEVGNAEGSLASGSIGDEYGPQTSMGIASASKWVFGAYALEKIKQTPDRTLSVEDFLSLSMRAGYGERKGMMCLLAKTIGDCADKLSETYDEKYKGYFFYSSGHTQSYANTFGLKDFTADQMTAEYKKYLGDDLEFKFKTMLIAGGLETTPTVYAKFLRKILSGHLQMYDFLGHDSACTSPYVCRTAVFSPAPDTWTYSYQHWVEQGRYEDGSFSSPGRFGFYPWISADKKYYGIIARHDTRRNAPSDSQACALDMRTAWNTGVIQE